MRSRRRRVQARSPSRILDADGQPATKRWRSSSDWWPGEPVWTGTVGDRDVAVQVRPILNGYSLSYRGIQVPVHVYTEREAELAALMPEKVAADTSKFLLCPMPGLVKAIHVADGAGGARPAIRWPSSRP